MGVIAHRWKGRRSRFQVSIGVRWPDLTLLRDRKVIFSRSHAGAVAWGWRRFGELAGSFSPEDQAQARGGKKPCGRKPSKPPRPVSRRPDGRNSPSIVEKVSMTTKPWRGRPYRFQVSIGIWWLGGDITRDRRVIDAESEEMAREWGWHRVAVLTAEQAPKHSMILALSLGLDPRVLAPVVKAS